MAYDLRCLTTTTPFRVGNDQGEGLKDLGKWDSVLWLREMRLANLTANPLSPNRNKQGRYRCELPALTRALASQFDGESFDAIISPPSRFPFASPYRKAFMQYNQVGEDWTGAVCRSEPVYAGSGADAKDLIRAFRIPAPTLERFARSFSLCKRLLIVDDVFWNGTTVYALLHTLTRCGLDRNTHVSVACPLRILPRKTSHHPGSKLAKERIYGIA